MASEVMNGSAPTEYNPEIPLTDEDVKVGMDNL